LNCAVSEESAISLFASTITPDVPLSRRCTMPGRVTSGLETSAVSMLFVLLLLL
jgi:hypothetical protein